jgi:threonine/homoserine/homoserine lactone efflux protein
LPTETTVALCVYALATSITPGPNNVILAASGANFGLRRTVPNMAGVSIGFASLLAVVGLGAGAVLAAAPALQQVLTAAAVLYLLYLGWRVARAGRPEAAGAAARPLRLWEAAAFQFVNPKAWAMALAVMAAFRRPDADPVAQTAAVTAIVTAVNLPCIALWAGFGSVVRHWLQSDRALRFFNGGLGALTALSALLLLV